MKNKLISCILAISFLLCAIPTFGVLAASTDSQFDNLSFSKSLEVSTKTTSTGNGLRGLAASNDGAYVYLGILQNNKSVFKIDAATGDLKGTYTPVINELSDKADSSPKGLATDDRGYLYVGLTHTNTADVGKCTLAVVKESKMTEVSHLTEKYSNAKTGINGVAVAKVGSKYLCYVACCYEYKAIKCYDVTNPANISLYKEFANDGILVTEYNPSYLSADTNGNVYVTGKGTSDSKFKVTKIKNDGSTVKQVEVDKAYGLCLYKGYVIVCSNTGANITVLNSDLATIKKVTIAGVTNDLADIDAGGKSIFIGDYGTAAASIAANIYKSSFEKVTNVSSTASTINSNTATSSTAVASTSSSNLSTASSSEKTSSTVDVAEVVSNTNTSSTGTSESSSPLKTVGVVAGIVVIIGAISFAVITFIKKSHNK